MDAAVDLRSSSNDLSSAPNSDAEATNANRRATLPNSNTITVSTSSPLATSVFPPAGVRAANGIDAALVKVRKPRKKKDDAAHPPTDKEKKPRKPRAAPGTGPNARKKAKIETTDNPPQVQQTSLSMNSVTTASHQSAPFGSTNVQSAVHEIAKPIENASPKQATANTQSVFQASTVPMSQPPPPSVPRSKPIYDPIRGLVVDRSVSTPPITSITSSTPPRIAHNASTSPAISGILNQPDTAPVAVLQASITQPPIDALPTDTATTTQQPKDENAMDVDQQSSVEKKPEAAKQTSKPRAKEQPPPLPAGSGLLSSSLFGGDSGLDAKSTGEKGPNIVLHIDLKDPGNKVINFARMAEDKYGFAALYPRQAAQKERLAKVAAAGAALERAASGTKGGTSASDSADEDGSVDIDRDSDNDGDAVMSGVNGKGDGLNSGTDGAAPRKRRKRKDEYDADDPFVDDSEMLWEAQAAASKDGFFVYIGPLVPEGEKATVERADGTVKRGRGRGRGGGPGSRGGRGGAAAAHAEGGSTRGGGPGSRGGGVTRKPRISKAERQQNLERKQRESMTVLAAKPPSAPP